MKLLLQYTARADCRSRIRLQDLTNTTPETTKEGFSSAALVVLLHSQYNQGWVCDNVLTLQQRDNVLCTRKTLPPDSKWSFDMSTVTPTAVHSGLTCQGMNSRNFSKLQLCHLYLRKMSVPGVSSDPRRRAGCSHPCTRNGGSETCINIANVSLELNR